MCGEQTLMNAALKRWALFSLPLVLCGGTCVGAHAYNGVNATPQNMHPAGTVMLAAILLGLFAGIPLVMMGYVDVVKAARALPRPESALKRFGLLLMNTPVFLGGLVSTLIGAGLMVQVFILTVQRAPMGGRVGFGYAMVFVTVGLGFMGAATRAPKPGAK